MRRFVCAGIRPKTLREYRGCYDRFQAFARESIEGSSVDGILRFLCSLAMLQAAAPTVEKHRSAILFYQRLEEQEESAANPRVVRLSRSLQAAWDRVKVPRGALELSQLEQLCSLDEKAAIFFKVCFFARLRFSEAYYLRVCDYSTGDSADVLTLVRNKRLRAGARGQALTTQRAVFFVKELRDDSHDGLVGITSGV